MMLLHSALLAATWSFVSAVFVDEAYQIDYHYPLLGAPIANTTFFHEPNQASKATLVYTLSEKSIIGAVNPKDGQIVWRQSVQSEVGRNGVLRAGLGTVLSATGSHISAWSAGDGRLVWNRDLDGESILDLVVGDGVADQSKSFVLSRGQKTIVRRIDSSTGSEDWIYEDPNTRDEPYRLFASRDQVFLVTVHEPMLGASYLKVTQLDAQQGTSTLEVKLDGHVNSVHDFVPIHGRSKTPFIAWIDSKTKGWRTNILGSKEILNHDISEDVGLIERLEVHVAGSYALLAFHSSTSHGGNIHKVDPQTGFTWNRAIPVISGHGAFAAADAIGGETYFARATKDELLLEGIESRVATWPMTGPAIPGLVEEPYPTQMTVEVRIKTGPSYAVRCAIHLSSGDWIAVRDGEVAWYRPEALAGVVKATWADLTDYSSEAEVQERGQLISAFVGRLKRHVSELSKLQDWKYVMDTIIARFIKSTLTSALLGLDKTVILATENGRFVAIDTAMKGRVIWNIPGRSREPTDSPPCTPDIPWTSKSIPSIKDALVCLGEFPGVPGANPSWLKHTGFADPRLAMEDGTVLDDDALLTDKTTYVFAGGRLYGTPEKSDHKTWEFSPSSNFKIHSVTPPSMPDEPIAAIGKVLGDRRVLYKYLNPNAIAVITVDDDRKRAAVHLVDATSGNVLYTSNHVSVDTSRPIASALSENWLAFSYTMDSPDDAVSKGYQIVMTEFYESDVPNDRGLYGTMSNFSTTAAIAPITKPYALTQSFHVPEEIQQMAVTQTVQGITSRQILVGLPYTNSIVGIPSQLLDPRRLIGKDPTQSEMMEGLSRYSPMIDFDPRWYLNHKQEIFGLRQIMTTPAQLESTSLVFAYGVDLFGTRVTPSLAFDILGNSFNKIQLVLTVVALFVGTFLVAPFIQRKQTNVLWQ